jgi:5-methylcytosine-specific restriction endonuclease McrA
MADRESSGHLETTSTRRLKGRKGWSRQWARQRRAWQSVMVSGVVVECPWCHDRVDPYQPWHLDHLIPVTAGGTDDVLNLHPMHPACNRAKGAQTVQPRVQASTPSRTW